MQQGLTPRAGHAIKLGHLGMPKHTRTVCFPTIVILIPIIVVPEMLPTSAAYAHVTHRAWPSHSCFRRIPSHLCREMADFQSVLAIQFTRLRARVILDYTQRMVRQFRRPHCHFSSNSRFSFSHSSHLATRKID